MNRTEKYIELYKLLEAAAVSRFGFNEDGSAVRKLADRKDFSNIRDELKYCIEVRNLLQHKYKLNQDYPVEPSMEMISLLERTLNKVRNPLRAKDVEIPLKEIFYKSMDDTVRPTMVEMQERVFTHVPILEDKTVVGVFSENTLLSYLVDEEIVEISDNLRFSDIKKYLRLNRNKSESFRFVKPTELVTRIKGIFEKALKEQERIGMIFITDSGDQRGKLHGLITAWDIAGKE